MEALLPWQPSPRGSSLACDVPPRPHGPRAPSSSRERRRRHGFAASGRWWLVKGNKHVDGSDAFWMIVVNNKQQYGWFLKIGNTPKSFNINHA